MYQEKSGNPSFLSMGTLRAKSWLKSLDKKAQNGSMNTQIYWVPTE
jgi:hypothetical protein